MKNLQDYILGSTLSDEDKAELIEVFKKMPPEYYEHIFSLIVSDSTWVEKMAENLKQKRQALQSGDQAAWAAIVTAEQKEIEKIIEAAEFAT